MLLGCDHHHVCRTARILSSKMSLCIVPLKSEDINNDNCYQYGLVNPGESDQGQQHPLYVQETSGEIYLGDPTEIDLNIFLEHRKYCLFVFDTLIKIHLIDSLTNTNNHDYFLDLVDEYQIKRTRDASGYHEGFKRGIEKILYLTKTEKEAKERIEKFLSDEKNNSRPSLQYRQNRLYNTVQYDHRAF